MASYVTNVVPEDVAPIIGDESESDDDDDENEIFIKKNRRNSSTDDGKDDVVDVDVLISPSDSYSIVYICFYFLGITTLLPWNFFINANKYWMYKFRDVNGTNSSYMSSPHGKTEFQASFTSYLAISSNLPSTICFIINIFISNTISAKTRMIYSLLVTFLFFGSQTALVEIDTDSWQKEFMYITLGAVVFMNAFCTFFQCGLFGIIGKFPHHYTTATMSGQALGGIFASVANILSIFLGASELKSAFLYFSVGSASLALSFLILTLLLPSLNFYRFHTRTIGTNNGEWGGGNYSSTSEHVVARNVTKGNSWTIFKKVWIPTVSAGMTFLVTLAAFPTLVVLIVSDTAPSIWDTKYYVPVVSFLVFAIGDYLGRIVSGFTHWPSKSSDWSLGLSVVRLLFIPILMSCNLHPRRGNLPIYFPSDILFALINFLFGFTNGYLTNHVFMIAPQLVSQEEQEDANGIVTMGLGIGLSLGVTLSYILLLLL